MKFNPQLVKKQDLSKRDLAQISKLHKKRKKLFKQAENIIKNKNNPRKIEFYNQNIFASKLKKIAKEVEKIEFALQKKWKFKKTRDRHTWWFYIPGCTCPKIDNKERMYTGIRIYSENCPIHGTI